MLSGARWIGGAISTQCYTTERAIIVRTNALTIEVTKLQLGCTGECAMVWTDQRRDRQMLGKDGTSQHTIATTQKHIEQWALRGSR